MFKNVDTKGLKFKLWGYFVLFAAAILAVLWFLQIVFLRTYYQSMKIHEIEKISDIITSRYGKSDFQDTIFKLSYNNGISIQIIDQNGNTQLSSKRFGDLKPPSDNLQTVMLTNKLSHNKDGRAFYITSDKRVKGQIIVYGTLLSNNLGKPVYLLINAQIAPIDMTTSVLQNQLYIVMIISLLMSFAVSIFIATKLALPILKITDSASELAKGNYNIKFASGNYTEINQLASTMNFATSELSKTDELRRELIANVSHDLRTPLTMIKMYAELIRDVSGSKPEKRDMHTKVIIDETDRLSALITDMLDLSKLQAGTSVLDLMDFDLAEKSKDILNRFQALSEHDGYIFAFNSSGKTMVKADEQKIEQVIYNLISNAVNYTGEDKRVIIIVKNRADNVRFEVTDTGKGIPKEELGQIWERYYKAKETHKRAVVGTGLGLSIVKGIIEAHNGYYGVESTVGLGSTFWFELKGI